ncbi:MAG: hypothetical protein Q8M15_02200 [Bacteroidota bacterium]|nr:hypothetical protein [Bacteroidota bacterium]
MLIENYSQLRKFIIDNKLTVVQAKELVRLALKVIFLKDYNSTNDFLKALDAYWEQWKDIRESPIFPDIDISLKE